MPYGNKETEGSQQIKPKDLVRLFKKALAKECPISALLLKNEERCSRRATKNFKNMSILLEYKPSLDKGFNFNICPNFGITPIDVVFPSFFYK